MSEVWEAKCWNPKALTGNHFYLDIPRFSWGWIMLNLEIWFAEVLTGFLCWMDGHWSRSEIVILKPNSRGTEGSVVGSRGVSSSVGHNQNRQNPEEPVEAMVILSNYIKYSYSMSISFHIPLRSWCSASDLREIDLRCEVWWFSQGTKGPVKSLNMCHLLWHWYSIDLCSKVPKLALTENHAPKISKCIGTATIIGSQKCVDPSREAAGVQADAVALFSTTCQGLVPDAGHSWGTWCDTQRSWPAAKFSSLFFFLKLLLSICNVCIIYIYIMHIYLYIHQYTHIYMYIIIYYICIYISPNPNLNLDLDHQIIW